MRLDFVTEADDLMMQGLELFAPRSFPDLICKSIRLPRGPRIVEELLRGSLEAKRITIQSDVVRSSSTTRVNFRIGNHAQAH